MMHNHPTQFLSLRPPLAAEESAGAISSECVLPSELLETNIVLVQGGNFGPEVAAQQPHQETHFALGPLPILFGKSVEGNGLNPNARRRLAQRPLPSMMIAMCFGSRSGSSCR